MQHTQKTKESNLKWIEDMDGHTFFQRRFPDGQQTHEKMLNITHQGNENQNHNEVSPHICQNG